MSNSLSIYQGANGVITAPGVDYPNEQICGAAYDGEERIIEESLRSREAFQFRPMDPPRLRRGLKRYRLLPTYGRNPFPEKLGGRAVFLGPLTHHFGHWLLETIGRLWANEEIQRADHLVYHPFVHGFKRDPLEFGPMQVVLEALELDPAKVRLSYRALRCEELAVPESMISIDTKPHPHASEFYRSLGDRIINLAKTAPESDIDKIYVSRRGTKNRPWGAEQHLEKVLNHLGFYILRPEQVSFAEQVKMFQKAQIVAGLAGSGLHNVLFSERGTRCFAIGGNPENVTNQRICCEAASSPFEHLRMSEELRDSEDEAFLDRTFHEWGDHMLSA